MQKYFRRCEMKQIRKFFFVTMLSVLFGITGAARTYAKTEMPMLAAGDGWYPFSVAKSNILSVEFLDSYEPDGSEVAVQSVDVSGTGEIRSYLLAGRKKVIVAGNGSGGILANPDCSGMFEGFITLNSLSNTEILQTDKVTNMESMFWECNNLSELNLRDLNTSQVTSMNSMFRNCNSLEYIDLQYWDLSNVEDMSYMFSNCASIDNLTFRLMKETKLEDVSYMFSDCYELKSLDTFGLKTDNVISMHKMFMNCCNLSSVDFTGWNISNVSDLSWLFCGCTNLTSVNLNGWNTEKVRYMDLMFDQCSSLTDVGIHWNTSSLTTAEGMFRDCSSMRSMNLSGFEGAELLNVDAMFAGCTGLENLDLSGMKLKSMVSSTQSDLFGNTVYSNLQSFSPPLGVRISMKMPETGSGCFIHNGQKLPEIPKNLESSLNLSVFYQVEFLDSEDEAVYGIETAEWGSIVATPSQPVKETEDYIYTFLDWCLEDGTVYRADPICSDMTVYAFWDKTEKEETDPGEVPAVDPEEPDEDTEEEPGNNGSAGSEGGTGGGSSGGGSGSPGGGSRSSGGSSSGSGSSGGGGGSGQSYRSTGTTPSGIKLTVANASATFSSFWKADAKGTWRIFKPGGQAVTSAWLCDDAVTENGKNVWYLIGTTGEMLSCGLVQDNTGNYYSLETTHNGFYGMLRCKNGFYSCGTETLYITFDHNHNGSFGAITSPEALEELKRLYGVTRFPIGNENCIYTSTF